MHRKAPSKWVHFLGEKESLGPGSAFPGVHQCSFHCCGLEVRRAAFTPPARAEVQEEWEPKACRPRCFADRLLLLRFAPTFVKKDCRMLGGLLWEGRRGDTTLLSGPWGFQEGQENLRIVCLFRLLVCRERRTLKGPPTLLSPASPFYPRGNWVPERESDLTCSRSHRQWQSQDDNWNSLLAARCSFLALQLKSGSARFVWC